MAAAHRLGLVSVPRKIETPLRVRFEECQPGGEIRASAFLRYAQDAAWVHSDLAGFDRAWYLGRGLTWVVRCLTLDVLGPSQAGTSLTVTTEVLGMRRVLARRHGEIIDGGRRADRDRRHRLAADRSRLRAGAHPARLRGRLPRRALDLRAGSRAAAIDAGRRAPSNVPRPPIGGRSPGARQQRGLRRLPRGVPGRGRAPSRRLELDPVDTCSSTSRRPSLVRRCTVRRGATATAGPIGLTDEAGADLLRARFSEADGRARAPTAKRAACATRVRRPIANGRSRRSWRPADRQAPPGRPCATRPASGR